MIKLHNGSRANNFTSKKITKSALINAFHLMWERVEHATISYNISFLYLILTLTWMKHSNIFSAIVNRTSRRKKDRMEFDFRNWSSTSHTPCLILINRSFWLSSSSINAWPVQIASVAMSLVRAKDWSIWLCLLWLSFNNCSRLFSDWWTVALYLIVPLVWLTKSFESLLSR